jgi:hypothetical protein
MKEITFVLESNLVTDYFKYIKIGGYGEINVKDYRFIYDEDTKIKINNYSSNTQVIDMNDVFVKKTRERVKIGICKYKEYNLNQKEERDGWYIVYEYTKLLFETTNYCKQVYCKSDSFICSYIVNNNTQYDHKNNTDLTIKHGDNITITSNRNHEKDDYCDIVDLFTIPCSERDDIFVNEREYEEKVNKKKRRISEI